MNKERATYILAASIEKQAKVVIFKLAKNIINKFDIEKTEPGQSIKLHLEFNILTDLLFEIEEHLLIEANGKKKRKRLLKKKYKK